TTAAYNAASSTRSTTPSSRCPTSGSRSARNIGATAEFRRPAPAPDEAAHARPATPPERHRAADRPGHGDRHGDGLDRPGPDDRLVDLARAQRFLPARRRQPQPDRDP